MARPKKYFPTQLETYVQCPLKYRYSQDPEIRDKYRRPSTHLYLGTCVHDALEAFFDISRVPIAERTYEKLEELLRRAWAGVDLPPWKRKKRKEEREQIFGGDRGMEASWGKKALHLLYRFYLLADRTVVPFTAEQFHEARLGSGVLLGGKVDRIDRLEDGSLKVIDYKTGKPPFRKDDDSIAEEDLQLSAYAIVVTKKYEVPVSRCSLFYLAHDEELGFSPSMDLLAGKAERITEIVREIEADEEFEPRENRLCPWCEYREICPVGKEIDPPEVREEPDVPF